MKTRTRFNAWIRRALGEAAIVGVIVVMTGWGSGLLTTFCVVKTAKAASQQSSWGGLAPSTTMSGSKARTVFMPSR
jgi:hypothetical protein